MSKEAELCDLLIKFRNGDPAKTVCSVNEMTCRKLTRGIEG